MILRRITSAIRNQNWSQVITEILIVVIGIFLGLQVTEWNEERENRVEERRYLDRLHIEIVEAFEGNSRYLSLMGGSNNELKTVTKIISGEIQAEELSPAQCHAIFFSHIFVTAGFSVPTMTELTSTGQLSIIQNANIKQLMSKYVFSGDEWQSVLTASQLGAYNFSDKYPELIEIDKNMTVLPATPEAINSVNHICHLDLMKTNKLFKNNLLDAAMRRSGFVSLVLQQQVSQLENIHGLLDQELGINH